MLLEIVSYPYSLHRKFFYNILRHWNNLTVIICTIFFEFYLVCSISTTKFSSFFFFWFRVSKVSVSLNYVFLQLEPVTQPTTSSFSWFPGSITLFTTVLAYEQMMDSRSPWLIVNDLFPERLDEDDFLDRRHGSQHGYP